MHLLTYIRSSVWYISIGYLLSSSAPYHTVIYDWTNAVCPAIPLLLVLKTQASGRSFPETPSGRLQMKIMPWRTLRYHIKSQSLPVKKWCFDGNCDLFSKSIKKTWFHQGPLFFQRYLKLLYLIPNRHPEIFQCHVSFPSKVKAKAVHLLTFWLSSTHRISSRNPFLKKNIVPSRASIFSEISEATILDS